MILAFWMGCSTAVDRGEEALSHDDLVGAEREFRSALESDPADAQALYGLGWTFYMAGEQSAANDAFKQLVGAHPESPLGHRGLGSVAAARGEVPAARKHLDNALARAPGDPRSLQSLALLDMREGKYDEALSRLDLILDGEPASAVALQTRAAVLLRADRPEEALAAADAAVSSATTPRERATSQLTRAHALMATSDGRVGRDNCVDAGAVAAWLGEVDAELDRAQAAGIHALEVADARREVRRRRAYLDATCPAGAGLGGQ
ncbi:MAG: tetratricopeptide repeat protein [Deltaproteobacteria bacterium]|nr:tetratricopeptide repeat protein [Deltaproteobacteria bacterium]